MNLRDRSAVGLLDVATVERAKSGKVYPAGSILIQVSATNGKLRMIEAPAEVEQKYAVIEVAGDRVSAPYLLFVLEMEMPGFLRRYQTTMNIQMDVFKHLRFEIHNERDTQDEIVKVFAMLDDRIDGIEREIDGLKEFKKWHLDAMFV